MTRLRPALVLLIVTFVVLVGCSTHVVKATVEMDLTLNSRQFNRASVNLGQMLLDGQGPCNPPYNTRVLAGVHNVRFIAPAGFYVVEWDVDGVFACGVPLSEGSDSHLDYSFTGARANRNLPKEWAASVCRGSRLANRHMRAAHNLSWSDQPDRNCYRSD